MKLKLRKFLMKTMRGNNASKELLTLLYKPSAFGGQVLKRTRKGNPRGLPCSKAERRTANPKTN